MSVDSIDTTSARALVFTPMETDWRKIVDAAVHAEEAGYDFVIVPEGWTLDAMIVLSEIARRTSRIGLVSGIISIWGRTAATLAMTAATLDDLSDGRFTLGIGTSTPALVERFHGVRFVGSADRLESTLRTLRDLLDGKRGLDVDGEPGLRLGVHPRPHVPIWVAGLGPRAVRTAVTAADGWFPALVPLGRLDQISSSAAANGPTVARLVAGPMVLIDSDREDGGAAARQLLGWYLTGMGTFYGDFVASHGFRAEVEALRCANPRPAPGRISWPAEADPLLDDLAAFGDEEAIAERLRDWDRCVDIVAVTTGPAAAADLHRLIDAGSPRPRTIAAVASSPASPLGEAIG